MNKLDKMLADLIKELPAEIREGIKTMRAEMEKQRAAQIEEQLEQLNDIKDWRGLTGFLIATLTSTIRQVAKDDNFPIESLSRQMIVDIVSRECFGKYAEKSTTEEYCAHFVNSLIPALRAIELGNVEELKLALHDTGTEQ